MSSSSLEKASFRLPWGREEVMVAAEAILVVVWGVSLGVCMEGLCSIVLWS